MKSFTAYFADCNAAHAAAFELSEGDNCGEIVVEEQRFENAKMPSFAFRGLVIGALLGYIAGAAVMLVSTAGFFGRISGVCGIIAGSVIGTVTGVLLDLTAYDLSPVCSVVRFDARKNDCAEIVRRMKRRGAIKISVLK